MTKMTLHRSALAALTLLPTLALAHGGHESTGLAAGLAHPLGGLDHILTMVAVGFWGASLGGSARWQLPLAFIVAMVAGGALGMVGLAPPGVEPMILASSVVIGLALALAGKINRAFAASLCAGFALFHGLAHGAEMPAAGSVIGYGVGFVVATLALHGTGLASASVARCIPQLHRIAGGAFALTGIVLSFG